MRILTVSRKRSQGVQLLVEEYKEKVRHYCTVEIVHIKSNPKNTSDIKAQIEGEDMLVVQNVRPEDLVVMLDEHGRDIGSKEMAELVGDAGRTGSSRLVFCIGGPYGHGAQLRARANVAIRLSSMVLNHQIALIVLLEQLYSGTDCDTLSGQTDDPCIERDHVVAQNITYDVIVGEPPSIRFDTHS